MASSPAVRARMQAQRTRDTGPELAVRRLLHAQGFRYRVDRPILPGVRSRADLVFSRARLAVFVDGCFWHGCPDHGRLPTANRDWWQRKIEGNMTRDSLVDQRLDDAGWTVVRVWEHEPPERAVERIVAELAAHPRR